MSLSGPGLELRPRLVQRPELRLTQQMQIKIKLLGMSRLQMAEALRQELIDNPALEVLPDTPERLSREAPEELPAARYPGGRRGNRRGGEPAGFDAGELAGPGESLAEHVAGQVRLAFTDALSLRIGGFIAGSLDRSGYLAAAVEEVAAACGASLEEVERVLRVMQGFDPPGVCGRDLRECLLIQLRRIGARGATAARIVDGHLPLLARKKLDEIAKTLGEPLEAVAEAARLIRSLEPKPGRPFFSEVSRWVEPDLYAALEDGRLVLRLNDRGMPRVGLSRQFAGGFPRKAAASRSERAYLRSRIVSARQFVDGLENRRQTLLHVAAAILERQRDFFEKGPDHIAPLALRDLKVETGFSEATLSRATSDKFVHTPHGLFCLRHFFSGALKDENGGDVSTASVRRMIREILQREDPGKPMSDAKICRVLTASGVVVARRTVAKYREQMRILPAGQRRRGGAERPGNLNRQSGRTMTS